MWTEIYSENSNESIYQNPDYAKIINRQLLIYKIILRMNEKFYCFYKNQKLILILPLYKKWWKNRYTLFGNKTGCAYLDAIYYPNITSEDFDECFSALKYNLKDFTIHYNYVKTTSLLGKYLTDKYNSIGNYTKYVVINLPDEYEIYNEGLSKNVRQNIRTAYNRINKNMCKINLCVYDSDNIPVKVKNEINSIYITRMTNRYDKKGGFLYKLFLNHFDAGSKALEQLNNRVLWFILNLNDSPIAFMAAFTERDHKTLVIPKTSNIRQI